MKVLIVEPNKKPRKAEIENTLEALQNIVGGYIETVMPFDEPVVLICNEEGKLLGLEPNRPIYDRNGAPMDVISGTFILAGIGVEDFVDLSDELAEDFIDYYRLQ